MVRYGRQTPSACPCPSNRLASLNGRHRLEALDGRLQANRPLLEFLAEPLRSHVVAAYCSTKYAQFPITTALHSKTSRSGGFSWFGALDTRTRDLYDGLMRMPEDFSRKYTHLSDALSLNTLQKPPHNSVMDI